MSNPGVIVVHLAQDGTEGWRAPLAACSGKPFVPPDRLQGVKYEFCAGCNRATRMGSPRDTIGTVLRESEIVRDGVVVQIGARPGKLDAHVRPNYLILSCDEPAMEMYFNDEDAEILLRVAAVCARRAPLESLREAPPEK